MSALLDMGALYQMMGIDPEAAKLEAQQQGYLGAGSALLGNIGSANPWAGIGKGLQAYSQGIQGAQQKALQQGLLGTSLMKQKTEMEQLAAQRAAKATLAGVVKESGLSLFDIAQNPKYADTFMQAYPDLAAKVFDRQNTPIKLGKGEIATTGTGQEIARGLPDLPQGVSLGPDGRAILAPGLDIVMAQKALAEKGMALGPNGQLSYLPGVVAAEGNMAGVKAGAEAAAAAPFKATPYTEGGGVMFGVPGMGGTPAPARSPIMMGGTGAPAAPAGPIMSGGVPMVPPGASPAPGNGAPPPAAAPRAPVQAEALPPPAVAPPAGPSPAEQRAIAAGFVKGPDGQYHAPTGPAAAAPRPMPAPVTPSPLTPPPIASSPAAPSAPPVAAPVAPPVATAPAQAPPASAPLVMPPLPTAGQIGAPPPGPQISRGPGGTTIMSNPKALEAGSKGKLEEKAINLGEQMARLDDIKAMFDPSFQTLQGKAGNAVNAMKDFVGIQLDPKQTESLVKFTQYRQVALKNLNDTIKDATGASMGVDEAKRIIATMPNPGTGVWDGDSPKQFEAGMNKAIDLTKNAMIRTNWAKANGVDPLKTGIELEKVPSLISETGQKLEAQIRSLNPKAQQADVDLAVKQALRQMFFGGK